MRKLILLLLNISVLPFVISQEKATDEMKTYVNTEYGYEVSYPANWEIIEAAPDTNNKTDWEGDILLEGQLQKVTFLETGYSLWRGHFHIIAHANDDSLNLDEWLNENVPTDVFDESLVLETHDTTLGGMPAKLQLIFGFDHTSLNFTTLHHGRIYSISFEGESPSNDREAEHREIYKQMLSSFRFIK